MASETNQTLLRTTALPTGVPPVPEMAEDQQRSRRVPWIGLVVAVGFLAASGGVRAWQSWGVDEALRQGRESPFPLDQLPMTLGDWKGETREMDSEIAKATGCTDHVFRSYRNDKTGSRIDLILLYGPTLEVVAHSPKICYPYAGFDFMIQPELRVIKAGKAQFAFSSMVFTKGDGGQAIHEEVYYSWGAVHPGVPGVYWAPDMGEWKQVERIPGLYKVHLQRVVSPLERREFGNPCEAFLTELMPWLDERYNAASSPAGSPEAPATPARSQAKPSPSAPA
ncbi:MAG TPA: exosortase-associated EpsI family protein [Isosphaeraceae bacterium]|nr:exosortase-associated EpsI family protein [Isosphaeraceae bacterium]